MVVVEDVERFQTHVSRVFAVGRRDTRNLNVECSFGSRRTMIFHNAEGVAMVADADIVEIREEEAVAVAEDEAVAAFRRQKTPALRRSVISAGNLGILNATVRAVEVIGRQRILQKRNVISAAVWVIRKRSVGRKRSK